MGETTDQVGGAGNPLRDPSSRLSDSDALLTDDATPESVDEAALIRADIEHTRAEMSETIDALQERLAPERIEEQIKEKVREQAAEAFETAKHAVKEATLGKAEKMIENVSETVGEATHRAETVVKETSFSIMEAMRENPIPFVLVGAGLGMLALSLGRKSTNAKRRAYRGDLSDYPRYGRTRDYQTSGSAYQTSSRDYPTSGPAYQTSNPAYQTSSRDYPTSSPAYQTSGPSLTDQAKETAEEVAERAKEMATSAASTVREAASTVADKTRQQMENVQEAGSSLLDTMRRNPLPFALIGTGLGMLTLNTEQRPLSRSNRYQYGLREIDSYRETNSYGDATSFDADRTSVTDKAKEAVSNVAEQTREQASRWGNQARRSAYRATSSLQEMVRDNPLAIGAAALAAGSAVGIMIPATRIEREYLGETRDQFLDKAQSIAKETIDKVQQVAQEAGHTIQKESQYQGLTPKP